MGPLPNLIYYVSVSLRGAHAIAEYIDGNEELPLIASRCIELLPPHHSRFSHTTHHRMFACIISDHFLYSAIADEALDRSRVMSFLEQVQHEFVSYANAHSLWSNHGRLKANCLDIAFDPIFRRLVSPFDGITQKEKDSIDEESEYQDAEADLEAGQDTIYHSVEASAYYNYSNSVNIDKSSGSRSPSRPLLGKHGNGKKYKEKTSKLDLAEDGEENKGKAFDKVHRLEIAKDVSSSSSAKVPMQRLGSMRSRGQQIAQRMFWRNVKVILLVDAIICLVLFGIWLGICRGFSCVSKSS